MKRIFYIGIFSLLISCNKKWILSEVSNNEIVVQWFYTTGVTMNSYRPEIVIVRKNGKEREIYKATDVITGVKLKDKEIIIRLYKPDRGIVSRVLPIVGLDVGAIGGISLSASVRAEGTLLNFRINY